MEFRVRRPYQQHRMLKKERARSRASSLELVTLAWDSYTAVISDRQKSGRNVFEVIVFPAERFAGKTL